MPLKNLFLPLVTRALCPALNFARCSQHVPPHFCCCNTHFIRGKQHTAVYLVIAGNTGQECLQCHRGAVVTPCRLRPLGKHVFFTWDLPRSNTFSRVSKLFESSLGRLWDDTVKRLLWKRGSLFVDVFIRCLIKKLLKNYIVKLLRRSFDIFAAIVV